MNKKIVFFVAMGIVCWGEVFASEGGEKRRREGVERSSSESEGEGFNPKRKAVVGEGQEESGAASADIQKGVCALCMGSIQQGQRGCRENFTCGIFDNNKHHADTICKSCLVKIKNCHMCRLPLKNVSIPGVVQDKFGANDATGNSTIVQQDGKLIVTGHAGDDLLLARYNANGTLDTTFGINNNGVVRHGFGDNYAIGYSVIMQQDGKLVVAGCVGSDMLLVRYNANGTLDTTFGADGVVQDRLGLIGEEAYSVIVQQDGKLVISGFIIDNMFLARYNAYGILDERFGINGVVQDKFGSFEAGGGSVIVQSDGKLVVLCFIDNDMLLVRYNTNGILDAAFGEGGIVQYPNAFGHLLIEQQDGKLVVVGRVNNNMLLARYNQNGVLDQTFGTRGVVRDNFGADYAIGKSVIVQQDGKLVVAGVVEDGEVLLARYHQNGVLDQTFGTRGVVRESFGADEIEGKSVIIQQDGKLIVVGNADDDMFLACYNADGTLDETFGVPAQEAAQAGPAEAQ